jgi:hypothetical protein
MTREEMDLCLDELELRIGKCSGLDAVKEYIRILPPGDYATSRLLFFSEATDQDQLLERCLTEVAIQDSCLPST